MAVLKRQNPKANPNNAIQLVETDGLCCGDATSVSVSDYTATVAVTAGTPKISAVRLGSPSVNYSFGNDYDPTQKDGRAGIKAGIEAAIRTAGYTAEGVSVEMVSTNLVVKIPASALVANGLNASGNAFTASNTQTIGF